MRAQLIANIKRALPAAMILGGLLIGLFTFPVSIAAANALIEDTMAADNSAASPADISETESTDPDAAPANTREDLQPPGMLTVTREQALAWLHSAVGVSIDFDGAYGAQCVDLIKAYYDFLGVGARRGNAQDYRSNDLPEGWQRIEGASPLPGDVVIYVGGKYGHVAIYESDYSTFHQNWGTSHVINMTDRPFNGISPNRVYWGVVRPFFPEYAGASADDIVQALTDLCITFSRLRITAR